MTTAILTTPHVAAATPVTPEVSAPGVHGGPRVVLRGGRLAGELVGVGGAAAGHGDGVEAEQAQEASAIGGRAGDRWSHGALPSVGRSCANGGVR